MLTDAQLARLCAALDAIPHLTRLRIHTRMPVALPSRITGELMTLLHFMRLTPIVVIHANHARELVGDAAASIERMARSGLSVLNQSVLLRGVNDNADSLEALSNRLIELGVLPYYLHQLDAVSGAAHFQVPIEQGRGIVEELRRRLPGYAVPRYVREEPSAPYKVQL
jgi:KamA family protein